MKYLQLFRWPNLLIIILTQYLLKLAVFVPFLQEQGIHFPLGNLWFSLLIISTLFIAIGGYLANDIADIEIDRINRPTRPLANGSVSTGQARAMQWFFEGAGLLLGLMVAIKAGNPLLVMFHVLVLLLMRCYARKLKCKGLSGNLVVALSSGLVVMMVRFYVKTALGPLEVDCSRIRIIVLFYAAFAFWFTLIREIVKDLEDLRGDKEMHCRTLAVRMPVRKLKYWLIGLSGIGLNLILLFQFIIWQNLPDKVLFVANFTSLDVIILFLLIPKLITANSSLDFGKIGNILKIIMLAGILYMLFLL
jgi:4-hydroxybenzoate polyprenyltransferase